MHHFRRRNCLFFDGQSRLNGNQVVLLPKPRCNTIHLVCCGLVAIALSIGGLQVVSHDALCIDGLD